MGQVHGVAFGELANRYRQQLRRRQDGIFDQQGDDDSVRVQGELDLAAHVIQRVVKAAGSVVSPQVKPPRADYDKNDRGRAQGVANRLLEIVARLNGIDVAKHLARAKVLRQAIEQATHRARGVRATITQEDLRHRSASVAPQCRFHLTPGSCKTSVANADQPSIPQVAH